MLCKCQEIDFCLTCKLTFKSYNIKHVLGPSKYNVKTHRVFFYLCSKNIGTDQLCGVKLEPKVIKLFFMLNLAETIVYPAHKCKKKQEL